MFNFFKRLLKFGLCFSRECLLGLVFLVFGPILEVEDKKKIVREVIPIQSISILGIGSGSSGSSLGYSEFKQKEEPRWSWSW
jgi:hypothetical protein